MNIFITHETFHSLRLVHYFHALMLIRLAYNRTTFPHIDRSRQKEKIFYCHNGIAQPYIRINRNTKKMIWMKKQKRAMKQQVQTGAHRNMIRTTQNTHTHTMQIAFEMEKNCSRICNTRVVCGSNSSAIWIWHYPSSPFTHFRSQIAAIFIQLWQKPFSMFSILTVHLCEFSVSFSLELSFAYNANWNFA